MKTFFKELDSYVITINQQRLKQRFRSHTSPFVFFGITDANPMWGCTQSHLGLWKYLLTKYENDAYVLIFEDDAFLHRNIEEADEDAISLFLNDVNGNILLLGFNPTVFKMKEVYGRLMYGYALDAHAYIIRVGYARTILEKYECVFSRPWGKLLLPMGSIDTLFVVRSHHILHPMLYVQNGLKNKYSKLPAIDARRSNYLIFAIIQAANRLHFDYFFICVVCSIITLLIFLGVKRPRRKMV